MSDIILSVENVSKEYQLGTFSAGTFTGDIKRWFYKMRGKEDPFKKIGINDRSKKTDDEFVLALQNINFEVKKGDVLGIIGKNGAGKSTLLKLLSRVTSPTTGAIRSAGRMASLLEVGTGFHPELTGRENIYLNGAILGMTKKEIESKIDEIVEFSGCAQYIETPVKRYSSGMRVRLGFAVAAFLEPEILIVDEVLAVGDFEFQKKAIGKMKDVARGDGKTVLFVSHNMESIKQLCTTGMVLDNGQVVFTGTSEESVDFYLNKNNSLSAKKHWPKLDGPGSEVVKLERFEIHDGDYASKIFIDTPIHLEIDIDCQLEGETLGAGIKIRDRSELVLFSDGFQFAPSKSSEKKKYKLKTIIPPKLLNAGTFYVDVNVGGGRRNPHVKEEGILSFEVEFGGDIKKRKTPAGTMYQELDWDII